jgi:hypothetical protein
MTRTRRALLAALAVGSLTAANVEAVVPPQSPLTEKVFRHADLHIPTQFLALQQLPAESAARVGSDISSLGLNAETAFYDARQGRLSSLILSVPLIPGTGTGNSMRWVNGRPEDDGAIKDAVWTAVVGYLQQNASVLRVDTAELSSPRIGVFEHGDIIQVYSPRVLNGIPVRNSSVSAIVNHGNLILLGLENWGDVAGDTASAPQIAADEARSAIAQHAQPFVIEGWGKDGHLEYIPMVSGEGYDFRLAWVIRATVRGDLGNWEGAVDAVSGQLLAFVDKNEYVARKIIGGVYPVSNDQRPPDGIEQPGYPMPFAGIQSGPNTIFSNAGGVIGCVTGTISSALVGRYTRIFDNCGAVNETSAAGDMDLGFGPNPLDTDCTVPAGHSAGDTKSSRSGFYELTRQNEQARGWLPNNSWLQQPLLSNMNINAACNAFWSGASVNFYRSNATCRNTGEIAAIFDHEWGHGMDNNGVNPNISGPGEAIADIHAMMRLNTSCTGRGFFKNQVCGGYGDGCIGTPATGCTGVRDLDFAQHRCNSPHTITWATTGFTSAQCGGTGAAPACPAGGGTPCGRETHCEGMVAAGMAWDLYARDLQGPPLSLDQSTALEIATRLAKLGSEAITNWYTCTVGGGCGATNGYMLYLGVDDDDGNITNGTPHMTAIRAAFERHEIHCATPAAVNSGCAGGPTTAPVVTTVVQDQGVTLNWGAVTGATRYYVYRTEGPNGPSFGKIKIAEVTGTTFTDTNLMNGRTYFFNVLPVGASSSCFGRMSAPVTVVPTPGANAAVSPTFTYTRTGGDGDAFLDNCERADVTFTVENTGTGALTNVRLVGVTFLTHPTSILITTLPAPITASLADCASATGTFAFTLQGATFGQSTQIRIDVTADQLPAGQVRSQVITITSLETDAQAVATRTFNFDTDLQGWTVLSGTFFRQAGGANGTPFHVSSTEATPDNCDAIRSPFFRVKATSTLSMFDRYQIEPTDPVGGPYDRANVGLRDVITNVRTVIIPSSGQLYTLTPGAINGTCEQTGQAGWNATSPGYPAFNTSTWNAGAFNPGGAFTNRLVSIEIRYGTDPLLHPNGLDFDEVTLTDFDELVADVLPNVCVAQAVAPQALAVDTAGNGVFENNETVTMAPTWQNIGSSAIALTGTASNFTGPTATYTIPDASASYGTIGVGSSASCTAANNCYSLAVAASPRPVTHWDSTVLETVNPTATTKTWRLHIGGSFTDVPTTNGFYRFVETILHKNVTGGCTLTEYCPTASTTREQMAVFVLVAKEPPGYTPPACVAGSELFSDVPASSGFCRWIEELSRRAVISGCGPSTYCPTAPASREAMAVFVLRTLDPTLLPPACVPPNLFLDVNENSPFCRWIEELANRGIVTGCGGGNYCPTADVSREQMSVFLAVTFSIALYGL